MPSRKEEIESWNRYYAERCDIDKRALEIGGRYDKLALAVSGGGFALSITFLEKIAHAPPFAAKVFLGISWFAFGLSILAQLFAMRYSSRALQLQIQDLDHSYEVESTGESSLASKKEAVESSITKCANSNEIGLWSAGAGLTALALFAVVCIFSGKPSAGSTNNERKTDPPSQPATSTTHIQEEGRVCAPKPSPSASTEKKMSEDPRPTKKEIEQKRLSKGSYVPPTSALKPPTVTPDSAPAEVSPESTTPTPTPKPPSEPKSDE